jgi:enolase
VSFVQENKEGLELLKTAIAKAGYTGKVGVLSDVNVLYHSLVI